MKKINARKVESAKTSSLEPKALEAPASIQATEIEEPDKIQVIVDRATWARGRTSCLLETHGKMCILGQYLHSIGVPDNELLHKASPSDLSISTRDMIMEKAPWLLKRFKGDGHIGDSKDSSCAMEINDNEFLYSTREQRLTELFKTHDVDLKFTG